MLGTHNKMNKIFKYLYTLHSGSVHGKTENVYVFCVYTLLSKCVPGNKTFFEIILNKMLKINRECMYPLRLVTFPIASNNGGKIFYVNMFNLRYNFCSCSDIYQYWCSLSFFVVYLWMRCALHVFDPEPLFRL